MNDETGTGTLTFTKVEAKKSWFSLFMALGDLLASIGMMMAFLWCLFCISTVDDRIKTLHQRIDTLKAATDWKFESAKVRMDGIQEKLPPPVSPRDVSQFEPKSIGTREKLLVESGGAYSEVAYIEGHERNGSVQAQRIVVRSNFTGVVYVQRKNGSFEVVYP